ncbi:protein of unknown function [Candidatus Methylomirabilis oxygeniifera]|uniref:Uncharacterized protein n=1 Tax=Methylomirabilis oxygeniifera TaxID=671143 RepID=D5MII6_METO1|nr:protein of unknown function [Candidatus Methylomirabilis oxyfera]
MHFYFFSPFRKGGYKGVFLPMAPLVKGVSPCPALKTRPLPTLIPEDPFFLDQSEIFLHRQNERFRDGMYNS